MKIPSEIRQLLSLSPKQAVKKILDVANRKRIQSRQKKIDAAMPTFSEKKISGALSRFFTLPDELPFSDQQFRHLRIITENFSEHRFDLLGSGWVQVKHGMECAGLREIKFPAGEKFSSWDKFISDKISFQNQNESLRIAALISPDYMPIDWQIDFKSGYRCSENSWYKDINFGPALGADLKVPLELGQFHHAPSLALAAVCSRKENFLSKEKYLKEFENQVLDFIASNPPRFGVQWRTAMDVAIRAVNWLVTYNLFASLGENFSPEFEEIFSRSIYEHGLHIAQNLEWASGMRANHYIGNICGLIFIAAHLPKGGETDLWLNFGISELQNEVLLQFLPDGGNFEASTSYHRLCLERVLWTTALVLALPEERIFSLSKPYYAEFLHRGKVRINSPEKEKFFSGEYFERIFSALEFTYSITKPNGKVPQIGDNDNNRFLKFTPDYSELSIAEAQKQFLNLKNLNDAKEIFLLENYNSHTSLIATGAELFGYHIDQNNIFSLEKFFMRELLKKRNFSAGLQRVLTKKKIFPDFGIYIFERENYWMIIRCGPLGQHGKGGHAHNDQLSYELNVGGRDFIVDPGTFVYSGLPSERNRFRSTSMHNTGQVNNKEQNRWAEGKIDSLFWFLNDSAKATITELNTDSIVMMHYGFSKPYRRKIKFEQRKIIFLDEYEDSDVERKIYTHFAPDCLIERQSKNQILLSINGRNISVTSGNAVEILLDDDHYSEGYGLLSKSTLAKFSSKEKSISWEITL